jgi:hypothetical protein
MHVVYFDTQAEAVEVAKECMTIIKSLRPWTSKWTHHDGSEFYGALRGTMLEWKATDGLVNWELSVGASFSREPSPPKFYLCVEIWGEDQMHYNWCVPCDGTSKEVIENCLAARKIDVDGGEIWRH